MHMSLIHFLSNLSVFVQKLLEEMKQKQPNLDAMHKCADEAVSHDSDPENVSVMARRTDAVDLRFNELLEKLEKEVDKTKQARDTSKKYNSIIEDVGKRVGDLTEKIDKPVEVAADPEKVKQGLIEVEVSGPRVEYYNSRYAMIDIH